MTKQEHKYAQVLRWIADGKKVLAKRTDEEDTKAAWKPLDPYTGSMEALFFEVEVRWEFRLAPRIIRVNGVEVPAPESKAPSYESEYFVADPTAQEFAWCYSWEDAESDRMFLERGLVYLRKEDAISRAKAMLLTQE